MKSAGIRCIEKEVRTDEEVDPEVRVDVLGRWWKFPRRHGEQDRGQSLGQVVTVRARDWCRKEGTVNEALEGLRVRLAPVLEPELLRDGDAARQRNEGDDEDPEPVPDSTEVGVVSFEPMRH